MTLPTATLTALATAADKSDYTDRDEAVEIALSCDLLKVDELRAGVAFVLGRWDGVEYGVDVLPQDAATRYILAELAYRARR